MLSLFQSERILQRNRLQRLDANQGGGFFMSQEMKHTKEDLTQMQSLPLEAKIVMTQRRIREWDEEWGGAGVC